MLVKLTREKELRMLRTVNWGLEVWIIYYAYIPIVNYYRTICRRILQIIHDGIMTMVGFSFVGNKLLLIT